ncbi:MAG: hypothetical protein WAO58_12555 [Fimbriimonadaceae bacterium]
MRGTQAILAGLILLGGIGMLVSMVGWVNSNIGLISAAVAVACFALMVFGDVRAAGKPGGPPDGRS